jgi:hypothetical protein
MTYGDLETSTVDVRIVNGAYKPCDQCHWYSVCIVPLGNHAENIKSENGRSVYQCIDYTSKHPKT